MEAQVRRIKDVTVVSIAGRLDIDHSLAFRKNSLAKLKGQKVAFVFSSLQFVGSNGIQSFFRCLIDLSMDQVTRICIAGLHKDFRRLFSVEDWGRVAFRDDLDQALLQFDEVVAAANEVVAVATTVAMPAFAVEVETVKNQDLQNSNSDSEKSMRSAA